MQRKIFADPAAEYRFIVGSSFQVESGYPPPSWWIRIPDFSINRLQTFQGFAEYANIKNKELTQKVGRMKKANIDYSIITRIEQEGWKYSISLKKYDINF